MRVVKTNEGMKLLFGWMIPVLVSISLLSCEQELKLSGFDVQKWKDDAHGCKGYREKVAGSLLNQRKMLTGANEKEVKRLLGKPDSQELQTRGQQYFVYEIKGGRGCEGNRPPALLRIRFDALDRVTELAIY